MDYNMTLDSRNYFIGAVDSIERVDRLTDNEGFNIELNNVFLDGIHLKWGKYNSPSAKSYSVLPTNESVVAHFCLQGSCITEGNNHLNICRGECILFKEAKDEYLYQMGTDNHEGAFFEISINPHLYNDLFVGENQLLDEIMEDKKLFARLAQDARFLSIISEMYDEKSKYSGKLKTLYLESKVMELLLLQSSYLQYAKTKKQTKMQARDIEALHQVKDLLDATLEHISIPQLALTVGINQTKLKSGFKELFGQTIFEYLTIQRMHKACNLLKTTELAIAEIAEMVGYKHAQHFTVAYYKMYGHRPSEVRG